MLGNALKIFKKTLSRLEDHPKQMMLIRICCCCSCSVTKSWPTLCNPTDCSTPGFSVLHNLLEFAQTHELVMPSNHLILCHSFFFLSSIFPSIMIFPNEVALCIRWPECWSFSFSISSSSEYSGLDSFRIDWLDLLAVQGTVKSLQHHSSKASILQCLAFFMVQLSHPYMTTGKTISLEECEKLHLSSKGKLGSPTSNVIPFLWISVGKSYVFLRSPSFQLCLLRCCH